PSRTLSLSTRWRRPSASASQGSSPSATSPPRGRPSMLRQLEGSGAVADAVALCRPEVIGAYPISPQTHIVERLSALVDDGELSPCEFINVESEVAALSAA